MSQDQKILEAMRKRRSVRTYSDKDISEEIYSDIRQYINNEKNITGPFGSKIPLFVIPVNKNVTEHKVKLGTYGIIKGPKAYIAGYCGNTKEELVDYGYVMEKLILHLTGINLGTCWLGGSLSRKSFEVETGMPQGKIIPAVTPIGYAADKTTLLDRTFRKKSGSDGRKEWKEVFYLNHWNNPLSGETAGNLATPIEMTRIAPSASNKQPWRIILNSEEHTCSFYLERTPKYAGNRLGFEIQVLDMGIAMCHFEMACEALEIKGEWTYDHGATLQQNQKVEYIQTFKLNQ